MAINYYTINGYTISLPLNDTLWYDLIIEKDNIFKSVQCKATNTENDLIDLRNTGGTKGEVFDNILNHPVDYLFCVNKDLHCWNIPVNDIREYNKNAKYLTLKADKNKNNQGFLTYKYLVL